MTEKIQLRHAHLWDCPKCGHANVCESALAEITPDVRAEMIDEGIDPDKASTGHWMTAPPRVECEGCGAEFDSKDEDSEEDQDE